MSFKEQAAYLCEITYAAKAPSLLGRLRAWDQHWEGLKLALVRDSGVPAGWFVRPWLFVPQAHAERLKSSLASLGTLPSPRITFLEDVVPGRYRSWNRGAYEDPAEQ
ncbi:hypothetical protein ACWJKH_06920 [Xanthomonas axonopodis pv. cassiae]